MNNKIYISTKFFTKEELKAFKEKHGYQVTEISYVSSSGEIDMSQKEEKEFLMKYGAPRILARFGF